LKRKANSVISVAGEEQFKSGQWAVREWAVGSGQPEEESVQGGGGMLLNYFS